jgi:UDP-glucose 4-epimerase
MRNVLYVDDAVSALVTAALSEKSKGETFFAAGDEHFSVADIAAITVRCIGRGRVKHVPWPKDRKAIEIGNAIISNAKIKGTLGWKPLFHLEEGLHRTREYFNPCLAEYI